MPGNWEQEVLVNVKSKTTLACLALATIFIIACPMPHMGGGPTKDTAGGADQTAPVANGSSISVVNDTARNQAVYINETGQRFDVVAAEYPGGPLVSCVQMTDFTVVPPSTDPNALPVKALVAGMRNDGSPGVWQIQTDDTILLPQPEVTDPSGARCIVGDDMTSLPDGIQIHLGWMFHATAFSKDGRMIVGYAGNPNGVTIGGVQILPTTTIGVYWRVYSLLGGRFCIVSAPHVIGSFTKQPPPKWAQSWPRSRLLQQLWLYISALLPSYLVNATLVSPDPQTAGVYDVTGTDDAGLPAFAKIDKSGNVTIQELVPDLNVVGVTASAGQVTPTDLWTISAKLENDGIAAAAPVTVLYYVTTNAVTTSAPFNPTTATFLAMSTLDSLPPQPGVPITVTSPNISLDKTPNLNLLSPGTYNVVVTASTTLQNGAIDFSYNVSQTPITIAGTSNTPQITTYGTIVIDTYDPDTQKAAADTAPFNFSMQLWSANKTDLAPLASDTGGSSSTRPTSFPYRGGPYIAISGLKSGDYWVLVQTQNPTDAFTYAIRVIPYAWDLSNPADSYVGWTSTDPTVIGNTTDQPLTGGTGIPTTYEPMVMDTSTLTTPLPNPPPPPAVTSTNHLYRSIAGDATASTNGANWIKLTLP